MTDLPKADEDIFSFELSEREWASLRSAIHYYLGMLEGVDVTNELPAYSAMLTKLEPERWATFRLSRERLNGLKIKTEHLTALPGPSSCCGERVFRATHKSRWRCYGCGRML